MARERPGSVTAEFPFTRTLPEEGAREDVILEFKPGWRKTPTGADEPGVELLASGKVDYFELAKDIAAFANTNGGTIFVGTICQPKDVLRRWHPVDAKSADAIIREYETAARDRCEPRLTIAPQTFEVDGGVVIAIHVTPFPAPVAVWTKDEQQSDGFGDRAWVFWTRVTSCNQHVSPEVLPMLMMPEIRRMAILLRQAAHASATVHFENPQGHGESGLRVETVDEMRNVVVFARDSVAVADPRRQIFPSTGVESSIEVPLDQIRFAFQTSSGEWIVKQGAVR